MEKAGVVAERTGKKIKDSLNIGNLSDRVAELTTGTGGFSTIPDINSGNVSAALSQLDTLRQYRDQMADLGFSQDSLHFGDVSEAIRVLEYDLDAYTQSLVEAGEAEKAVAEAADDLGDEARKTEPSVSKASRSLREMSNSGRRLISVPGFLRRIGDSAGSSNGRLERMVRTIRNVSVVSFGLRIARGLFGEFSTIIRNHISQDAQLQAQVNGLSASLGQSLAPAIGLVTNTMSYLMPYVVGVSNAFSSLMATLFGSGWSAAASGANKTAAATGGAAKAQKELNRQLMSFDQINKLQSQTDSSSGSGGAGSAMAAIEGKTPAWMERFKASFTELFNSSEFQSANVGGKIGQILQTGLDWIGQEGMNFDWRGAGERLRENFDSFFAAGWKGSFFSTLLVYLGGFADFVLGFLFPQWDELKAAYQEHGTQGAIDFVGGMITGFFMGCVQWMANVGQWIKDNITDPIVNWVKNLLGIHSPSTVFSEIGVNCMDGLGGGFSSGVSGVLQKLTDLKDRVLGIAGTLRNAFSFEWRMPHLRLPHLSVAWDPVDNILAKFFGVTAFPRLNVDWYAKGFITNGTSIFNGIGIGERGREALLPLDSNDGWKDEIAQRIAMILDGGNGGDVTAVINFIVDGDVVTTKVINGLRKRARAGTATF